jgi:Fuc2NAc and GlcNAc transferase
MIFLTSTVITYIVRYFALKKKIIDIPNERSSHTVPTPRGGGLAIVAVWYASLIYFFIRDLIAADLFYALACGLLLTIVSLADDLMTVHPKIRIAAQAATVGGALYFLGGLKVIDFGFFEIRNVWFLTGAAFFGLIWLINLFNFIDGIDGYAASESVFIFAALFLFFGDSTALILATATFGFLIWNWQKAKIFMGDVGSTMLGFTFGVFAIYYQNAEKTSLIVFLILSSLFWFDATLTLIRRFLNKEQLSSAHRKHAYQRLVQSGFSHQKTVIFGMILNLIFLATAYLSIKYHKFSILFLIFVILILFMADYFIGKRKPFENRKKNESE